MKIEQILLQNIKGIKEVGFCIPVKFDFIENDEKGKELFYYRMFNPKASFVEWLGHLNLMKMMKIGHVMRYLRQEMIRL